MRGELTETRALQVQLDSKGSQGHMVMMVLLEGLAQPVHLDSPGPMDVQEFQE